MKALKIIFLILIAPFALKAQDVYEVKFRAGVTLHRAAMIIFNNGTGKLRVRYYSGGTKMVEQSIVFQDTKYGIRLACYNPVYPGTKIKYPTYSPDNFYLSIDEYGKTSLTNVDDRGVTAECVINKKDGTYAVNQFLSDFDWKLN